MKLNPVEFAVGFLIQIPFYYFIGLWIIPVSLLSGFLWSIGGAAGGLKFFRRLGVPLLSGFVLSLSQSWVALLGIPFAVLACSLGYGEKSWVWCFFYNHDGNHKLADYLTRMITYFIYWASFGIDLFFGGLL